MVGREDGRFRGVKSQTQAFASRVVHLAMQSSDPFGTLRNNSLAADRAFAEYLGNHYKQFANFSCLMAMTSEPGRILRMMQRCELTHRELRTPHWTHAQ